MAESTWYEKYRPKFLKDMVLTKDHRNAIEKLLKDDKMVSLLLYSSEGGTGKTTLAKVIVNEMETDSLFINASTENGIDTVRDRIFNFSQTLSFSGAKKIVILDECDGLTSKAQMALRGFIEEFSENCKFILTCNQVKKIIEPLQQRCIEFDFDYSGSQYREELKEEGVKRLMYILEQEKIEVLDDSIIEKLYEKYFPSFRRMIQLLQKEAESKGSIGVDILTKVESNLKVIELLLDGNWFESKLLIENESYDCFDVVKMVYNEFVPRCKDKRNAILYICHYEHQMSSSMYPEIQLSGLLIKLSELQG